MADTVFLRKVASMSIDGIYVYDLDLQTNVYINERYLEITGYRIDDLNAMSSEEFGELFHPSEREAIFNHIDEVVNNAEGRAIEIRYRFRHKEGHWIWCQSRDAVFTRNAAGRCTQFMGSFIDITDLMEREMRARDLGIMMATMLENANTACLVLDLENQLHVFNAAAQRLFDAPAIELPAPFNLEPVFAERENLGEVEDPLKQAREGKFHDNELYALYPGGDKPLKYVQLTSIPLDGTDGNRFLIAMRDITSEEATRQQRERSERLDALGQLTGGIAHDFNNVLASILPSVQVAHRLTDDPQMLKLLGIIESSTQRGAQLAWRLLAFARRQPMTESDVRVSELLESLKELAESTVGRQVELLWEKAPEDLHVHCDAAQLENALLNLILNARDAILETGKGSQITVAYRLCDALSHPGKLVEFSVTDDGPGMTEAVQARAFDPFFTTRSNTSGTGLGLSTVYGFAKQAEGNVKLYSQKNTGTSVRLTLPAIGDSGTQVSSDKLEDRQDWIKGHNAKVLVVEDEPDLLQSVVESLRLMEYVPVPALNGELALAEMAKHQDIALMLTDIMMPGGMNGFELALAAREIQPDLKIVYMSGYTGFVNDARRHPDGDFLQKPCDMISLSQTLHQALLDRENLLARL
ncbi:ATP-binding protein [Roseibium sp.]|uniref:hybrid sensor histidine kinase/response regulator n=1 Tax=Roseibium sp. TaxID=1936156 RepID=UPI003A986360